MRHPAVYSDALLPVLAGRLPLAGRVLDPFAGTGKIGLLKRWCPQVEFFGVELEPEWAVFGARYGVAMHIGDARALPFASGSFQAICTSPTYGNRMADHFEDGRPERGWVRNTYRHALGRPLTSGNSGMLQWGEAYRALHRAVWAECRRVLAPGGCVVLNVKDHIRGGEVQGVTAWHVAALTDLGFVVFEWRHVPCPGNGFGANGKLRVAYESVIAFMLSG